MLKLWGKKKPVSQVQRLDGYRSSDIETVLWFQRTYENDYPDAVRAGLLAARDSAFVVTKQSLMQFINDEIWHNMGGTYN